MPAKELCTYVENWIAIKIKYSLTVDAKEATKLNTFINSCGLSVSSTPTPSPVIAPTTVITLTPTPVASDSSLLVNPGAFCSPAGAIGKSTSGVTYTCKTSPTDSRNRWRQ
jgi:hypothetical protein